MTSQVIVGNINPDLWVPGYPIKFYLQLFFNTGFWWGWVLHGEKMGEVGAWWSVTSSSLNPLCPKSKTVRIQLIEPTLVLSVNIWCFSRMLLEALALLFNNLTKYSLHIHTPPEVSSGQHGFINLICLQKCFGAPNRLVSLPDAQLAFLTWLWRQTLEKFSPFSGVAMC